MSPSLPFFLRLAVSLCPHFAQCVLCSLASWNSLVLIFGSLCVFDSLPSCPPVRCLSPLCFWTSDESSAWWMRHWDTLFKTPVVDGIHHIPTVGKAVLYGLKITSRCIMYISLFWNLLKRMNDRTGWQNQISQFFWPNASIDILTYMTYFYIFLTVKGSLLLSKTQ